jgi:hypothetical protein
MSQKFTARVAGAIAIVGLAVTMADARGSEPMQEPVELTAMARAADSPREHAQVAKQYRLRAEEFEAKAAKHEAAARKLYNHRSPLSFKWPAPAGTGWKRESDLAVQARRAAQECYASAARHVGLAVEGQQDVD